MKLLKILGMMAIFLSPIVANAHAGVVSTFPTQDQVLDVMPLDIQVEFSEELLTLEGKSVNTLLLTNFDGPAVEISDPVIKGNTISATIPDGDYQAGVYEVVYKIVSADGHQVSDSFTFSVNTPMTTSAPYQPAKNDGVLPPPIVAAVVILTLLAGLYIFRARKR
jgi:methionine-rich copper-binding protein CopC